MFRQQEWKSQRHERAMEINGKPAATENGHFRNYSGVRRVQAIFCPLFEACSSLSFLNAKIPGFFFAYWEFFFRLTVKCSTYFRGLTQTFERLCEQRLA